MKKAILVLLLLTGGQKSFANFRGELCGISRNSQSIMSGTVSNSSIVFLSEDLTKVELEITAGQMTRETLTRLNGRMFVSFSVVGTDRGIVIGRLDLNNTGNVMPIEAIAIGKAVENYVLGLIHQPTGITVSCTRF